MLQELTQAKESLSVNNSHMIADLHSPERNRPEPSLRNGAVASLDAKAPAAARVLRGLRRRIAKH